MEFWVIRHCLKNGELRRVGDTVTIGEPELLELMDWDMCETLGLLGGNCCLAAEILRAGTLVENGLYHYRIRLAV